jgi:citrate lyase beta subunit
MPDIDLDRPRRTILYLPAIRAGAVAKARTLDADCIILDLEDSVAPDMKSAARAAAVAAAAAGGWGHRELLLRVNGLDTEWALDDFAAAAGAPVAGIVVPKVASPADARRAVELAGGRPVWAMVETPAAVLAAAGIAATRGVCALVAGFADLSQALHLRSDAGRAPLFYSMGAIVVAARAAGVLAFDGIYADIRDGDGLHDEAVQARAFGFEGKTLIHPGQVDIVNAVFAPSAEELRIAEGLIAAHGAALADGRGVTSFEGRIVENLHVAQARQTLANAARLAGRPD